MQSWITERTGRDDLDCPVCGRSDFGVGAVMFMRSMRDAPRILHDGDAIEGLGMIPVACNHCGYVMFFDFQQCAPNLVKEYM
jgi:RNA polymerase subunit RPABC4/transcription elongation factor Spt4